MLHREMSRAAAAPPGGARRASHDHRRPGVPPADHPNQPFSNASMP